MSSPIHLHEEFGPKQCNITSKESNIAWIEMWKRQITPWNIGKAAPALTDAIAANKIPSEGRFLVPGCGQVRCVSIVLFERDLIVSPCAMGNERRWVLI